MKKGLIILLILLLVLPSMPVQMTAETTKDEKSEKQLTPAFPGAEGGGKYTTGGRGGDVYYVTNLNDSGPGSLREGVSRDNTTIIFQVGGTIELESTLKLTGENLTIAGQTAPGEGISLVGHNVTIEADNIIVRYLRFRLGDKNLTEADALSGRYHENIMIDHSSFSWSVDEVLSLYANLHTTVQYSIISESMLMTAHHKGRHGYGGIQGGYNASFHHNLFAHNFSRNPRFPGTEPALPDGLVDHVDFQNNVIYNWGLFSSYGGENGQNNIADNYYKPGVNTYDSSRELIFADMDPRSNWFLSGNYMDGSPEVTADNWKGVRSYTDVNVSDSPKEMENPLPDQSATDAFQDVLANSGAILPRRDAIDARIVNEVENGTGHFINSQQEVGGYPDFAEVESDIADEDQDGMPDQWEADHGLDSTDPADRNDDTDGDGYTNLEEYLNTIAANGSANPTVSIQSPAMNDIHETGSDITIEANASDSDGAVEKVVFYQGSEKLGEDSSAPYTYQWSDVPEGTHHLTAKAIDDTGTSTDSSNVVIHVNTEEDISPWASTDIGNPGIAGHTEIDGEEIIVKSSGDVAGATDHFHYAYQELTGNGEIVAKVEEITGTDNEAEAGVMIREDLKESSPMVTTAISYVKGGKAAKTFTRSENGAELNAATSDAAVDTPYWVRITRIGDQFTSSISADGESWTKLGTETLSLDDTIYFGLMADAAKPNDHFEKLNRSLFSNVSLQELSSEIPDTPKNVEANAGDKQVTLSWDQVDGAASYKVKQSTVPGGPYQVVEENEDTNYTVSDLTAGKTYYFVISAKNEDGESFPSTEVSAVPRGDPETIYYIDDDFEEQTVNEAPADYTVGPVPQVDINRTIVAEVPKDSDGNNSEKAVKLHDEGGTNVTFAKNFAPQKGTVVVEMDFMQPSMAGTSRFFSLQNEEGDKTAVSLELRKPAGEEEYTFVYSKSGAYTKLTDRPEDNAWYHFKMVANAVTSTTDIYIDDQLVAEDVAFSDDLSEEGIARIASATPGSGGGHIYFDNIQVFVEPVEAPEGLDAIVGDTKVQLNWQATEGATSYNVKRSETSGGDYTMVAEDVTDTSFTDSELINGRSYYYVISSNSENGESPNSEEIEVTPTANPEVPPAPEHVTVKARNTQVNISWEAVEHATSYVIKRATNQAGPYEIVAEDYTETFYTDSGLTNGTTYYYVIAAKHVGGESLNSEQQEVTPVAALTTPAELKAEAGNEEITLNWEAVEGATEYEVKRAENSGGPFEKVANVSDPSYTDQALLNGKPYYYIVTAKNGDTVSLTSQVVVNKPKADDGKPSTPTGIEISNPDDGKLRLSWQAVEDADAYVVKRRESVDEPFETIADNVTEPVFIDEDLTTGTDYYYLVHAVNDEGQGYSSEQLKGTAAEVMTVAKEGSGDYETVQAAIDAVPDNNETRTVINIKSGEYREKIVISREKSNISLIGKGDQPEDTVLIYDDNAKTIGPDGNEIGTSDSYSMLAQSDDFVAENLTIENDSGNDTSQALALSARGDRQVYRNVRLIGWQDTLLATEDVRQYYVDSYISGDVDFIFGDATAVFDQTVIHSRDSGYVTAASTQEGKTGYIFYNSKLTAAEGLEGEVELGRPWRPYSNVAYINTWMDDHIKPNGWNNWGDPANEETARYSEFANSGPGGDPQARYSWSKQLTAEEAAAYTPEKVLAGEDNWNPVDRKTLLNSNAGLTGISIDGEALTAFDPSESEYEVTLSDGTTAIPTVTADAASEQSSVSITEAADMSEQTVIEVVAEDGITQTYRLSFVTGEEEDNDADDTTDENTDESIEDVEIGSDGDKNNDDAEDSSSNEEDVISSTDTDQNEEEELPNTFNGYFNLLLTGLLLLIAGSALVTIRRRQ
ncbi:pectinesterase family protein [Gracilibacillus caseinilyticus]|uniref:Pectinesterase family protein n=1 Tax=Gracilibacillus caseinilyticus TaxID=2932256 RepID=A0ABY4EXB0_9BACI|nr:pectinesterase family protein [Gracilibacillus caseinilyticus]UOQ48676.1 pectinesterase family protein [Gracilibacillus caseinilyticus]